MFPDDLVIIREATAVDFNLVGKMFDLVERIRGDRTRAACVRPDGYLSTEYGYQSIRAQPISGSVRYPAPRLLAPDAYPILDNGGPIPEPNSVYLSPPLQRDSGAVQGSRCESFEKYPASQVFKDFTGDAVDVSCKSMSDKAVTYQNREAYLYDYGISVRLFEINEDGLSVSRIREVSITR